LFDLKTRNGLGFKAPLFAALKNLRLLITEVARKYQLLLQLQVGLLPAPSPNKRCVWNNSCGKTEIITLCGKVEIKVEICQKK
jgi:hypothetical protein